MFSSEAINENHMLKEELKQYKGQVLKMTTELAQVDSYVRKLESNNSDG